MGKTIDKEEKKGQFFIFTFFSRFWRISWKTIYFSKTDRNVFNPFLYMFIIYIFIKIKCQNQYYLGFSSVKKWFHKYFTKKWHLKWPLWRHVITWLCKFPKFYFFPIVEPLGHLNTQKNFEKSFYNYFLPII